MSKKKLNIAFVGCGYRASLLQRELYRVSDLEFVAVCDLVEEKARFNSRYFGAKAWYTDYKRMIEKEDIDIVAVVGHPDIHAEIGLYALEQGKHVYLEKPIALNAEAGRRLYEAAKKRGKVGGVGYLLRQNTAILKIKEIEKTKEFGTPVAVEVHQCWPMPRENCWGRESLLDSYLYANTVHAIDLLRYLMDDEIASLWARMSEGEGGTLTMSICLEFSKGGTGTLTSSNSTPSVEMRCDVFGSKGRIVGANQLNDLRYLTGEKPGYSDVDISGWSPSPQALCDGEHPGNYGLFKNLAESILAGTRPCPDLEDGYRGLVVVDAVRESVKTGRVVEPEY